MCKNITSWVEFKALNRIDGITLAQISAADDLRQFMVVAKITCRDIGR